MLIKAIVIEGLEKDVRITRTDAGASVTVDRFSRQAGKHNQVIAVIGRDEDRDARYAKATEVARVVYGTDRRGRPQGTNSMIHDLLGEIERVAGC